MLHASIAIHVAGSGESSGYEILLYVGSRCVAQYSAGGNPRDSQAPGEVDVATCRRWAYQTVRDMFHERFRRYPRRNEVDVSYDECAE